MNIHWFQHVPYEGLGSIAEWAVERGHSLKCTRWYEGETAPDLANYDWLVVMGGPMNVDEDEKYAWLTEEKAAIAEAIKAGKTVVGICLGAQLIARTLNSPVEPNGDVEIGWGLVTKSEEAAQHPVFKIFPNRFTAFHWHGDRFTTPQGAVRLGGSEICPEQGFAVDHQVLALQFHLELRAADLAELASQGHFSRETGPHIATAEEILKESKQAGAISNKLMFALLDKLEELNTQ